MIWSDYFSDWIYEKGKQLAELGRVRVVDRNDSGIVAHVKDDNGNKKHVMIRKLSRNILMTCSCPIGLRDGRCEHEAAAFYVLEHPETASEKTSKKKPAKKKDQEIDLAKELISPYESNSRDYRSSYSYYRFDRILEGHTVTRDTLDGALSLYKSGDLAIDNYSEGFDMVDRENRLFEISAHMKNITGLRNGAYLVFSKDEAVECSCDVPGCRKRNYYKNGYYQDEFCEHTLCMIKYAADRIIGRSGLPSDATNMNAELLMKAYRSVDRLDAIDATESIPDVILEPKLSEDGYGDPELEFKIGTDRMYVLKDMEELIKVVENRETLKLGKKNMISFGQHTFTESSQQFFDLIKEYVRDDEEYSRGYYSYSSNKSIPLDGKWIDLVYDLLNGKRVEYKEYGEKASMLTVEDCDYRPKLTIDPYIVDGETEGVLVTGTLDEFMSGRDYMYLWSDTGFSRVSESSRDAIAPLLEASEGKEDLRLKFGRNRLGVFYNDILPRLSDYCDIENNAGDEVEVYVPPQAMFRFYLDATEDDITLGAEAVYDEEVFAIAPDVWREEAYRDVDEEMSVLYFIQTLFDSYDPNEHLYYCEKDENRIYHILEYGVTELMAMGEVNATDAFKRLRIRRDMKLTLGVSLSAGLLTLDIQTDDLSQDELIDILCSYQKKKKFHRLKNGDFVSLEEENTTLLSMLLNEMGVSPKEFVKGKMNLPSYRAVYLDAMLQHHEEVATERDAYFKNTIRQISSIRNSEVKPPKSLKNVLRNYQLYGFRFLRVLSENGFSGILADDMGLGKTIQVLALLMTAKEQGEAGTSIVICPASLVYNWIDEAEKFAPGLSVAALAGSPAEREEMLSHKDDYDLIVTSYGLLTRDVTNYEDLEFNYQIIDEAQYIKNARTASSKAVRLVHAAHRIALTGTPIENRLSELWSIFDFLMPGFLYGYEEFRRRFETPIVAHKDEEAAGRLRRMISPFVLRRLKKDVLKDLPDKLEESRSVVLPDDQRKLYDGQVAHLQQLLQRSDDAEFDKNRIQILAEITKLRQICCDPALLYSNYKKESAKREALLDLVNEAIDGGHKMLVFSQFTSMLDLIQTDMEKNSIRFYRIDGSTSKKERIRLVNDFNKNDTPVFLISLKAGGTGLNLTGADVVIHYDPWWNIAVQNQATDRAHRIGQENVVSVFKLIAKNTIEEKIAALQETKRELADEILSGEGGSLTKMSKEELLELLG